MALADAGHRRSPLGPLVATGRAFSKQKTACTAQQATAGVVHTQLF